MSISQEHHTVTIDFSFNLEGVPEPFYEGSVRDK